MSYYDSPIALCEIVQKKVLTDEAHAYECAPEHRCPPDLVCPLFNLFIKPSKPTKDYAGSLEMH